MTAVRDTLVVAKTLVERGWERLAFATTPDGRGCSPYDTGASSYCALGAILRAGEEIGGPARAEVQEAFCVPNGIPMGGISTWNGRLDRTHAQVVEAFERAIAACPQEQP